MNSIEIAQEMSNLILKSISKELYENFIRKYSLIYYSKVATETQNCLSKTIRSSEIPSDNFKENFNLEPVI